MARILTLMRSELGAASADWDQFWFTPALSSTLGLMRWISGGLVLYTHLVWSLKFSAFFGDNGWQDASLISAVAPGTASCSFWWIVPEPWRFPIHLVCLAALFAYVVGLFLRVSAPLAWMITVSYAHRVPQATFGLDQINTLLTAYLAIAFVCLSARDAALSLDRWVFVRRSRRRSLPAEKLSPRPQAVVCVATRLIQLHLSIIYLYSGLSKLKGETWWDGTALWLAVSNLEYQSGDLTWLARYPAAINLLTVGTVMFEMLFPILIWNRRLRPLFIVTGLLLHLGIGKFLGMWTFGIAMQICYLSFLPPSVVEKVLNRGSSHRISSERGTSVP